MQDFKYPIGKYEFHTQEALKSVDENIRLFAEFPIRLKELVSSIDVVNYTKTYRSDGWNIRQLVHHLADSHANMYIRVKSALAKDGAIIMGYDESIWATFSDNELPLNYSIMMIEGIHIRLSSLFRNFTDADFQRSYFHNGDKRTYTLLEVLGLYVWHGNHHLAHIKLALNS